MYHYSGEKHAVRLLTVFLATVVLLATSCNANDKDHSNRMPSGPINYAAREDMNVQSKAIESAVQSYFVKYDIVPPDFSSLVASKELDTWPVNPYTGAPMKNCRFEESSPGDFTYLVGTSDTTDEHGTLRRLNSSYLLVFYGKEVATLEPSEKALWEFVHPIVGNTKSHIVSITGQSSGVLCSKGNGTSIFFEDTEVILSNWGYPTPVVSRK